MFGDMFTRELARVGLFTLVPLVLAVFAGNRLLRKMQHQHLRFVAFFLFFLIGIYYLFRPEYKSYVS